MKLQSTNNCLFIQIIVFQILLFLIIPSFSYSGPYDDLIEIVYSGDVIEVPIRVCQIENSPTYNRDDWDWVTGGAQKAINEKIQRLNKIWFPQTKIKFVYTQVISDDFSGAPIDDPDPPPEGPGFLGDMVFLEFLVTPFEVTDAINACERRWNWYESIAQMNFSGPIILIARTPVNSGPVLGVTYLKVGCSSLPPICEDPTLLGTNDDIFVIVQDDICFTGSLECVPQSTILQDAIEQVLPHELGHVLYLMHGNGKDDDGDGLFDDCCDNDETGPNNKNLMSPIANGAFKVITQEQANQARKFALLVPGARVVRRPDDIYYPVIANQSMDAIKEVGKNKIDIAAVGFANNDIFQTITISHRLYGTIPTDGEYRFITFVDLDGELSTGGYPVRLGFDTKFEGAELVTEIIVGPGGLKEKDITGRVWIENRGKFTELPIDSSIQSRVFRYEEVETKSIAFDRIEIEIPRDLLNKIASKLRLQAFAEKVGDSEGRDILPDDGGAAANTLMLVPPPNTFCRVRPDSICSGSKVNISAGGLLPNTEAIVKFDDQQVKRIKTDSKGQIDMSFEIPNNLSVGTHLVYVMTNSNKEIDLMVSTSLEIIENCIFDFNIYLLILIGLIIFTIALISGWFLCKRHSKAKTS